MRIFLPIARMVCLVFLLLGSACFPDSTKPESAPAETPEAEPNETPVDFPPDAEMDSTATVSADSLPAVAEPMEWVAYPSGIPLKDRQAWPVDQAPANPDFLDFRKKLQMAIAQKDTQYLLEHVDDEIKPSIADGEGKDFFIEMWGLGENAQQSEIWNELDEILKLGGIFHEKELTSFSAPYVFQLDEMDMVTEELVIGSGVRLRKQPGSAGEVVSQLSYEVVKLAPINWDKPEPVISEEIAGETHLWQKVITRANDTGFVYSKYLRSPIDMRVRFVQKPEGWRMVSMLAGD